MSGGENGFALARFLREHSRKVGIDRAKAALRRTGGGAAVTGSERVGIGKCLLDIEARRLMALSGEEIVLRADEFER